MINLIQIGKSALKASELQLEVTGNNIANASTDGYSRQTVTQTAADPISTSLNYYSTGVDVSSIERVRDEYLDDEYRDENTKLNTYSDAADQLSALEESLNELSGTGLTDALNDFYDDWENISSDPSDLTYRQDLLEDAQTLVDAFHNVSTQLSDAWDTVNQSIGNSADEINNISSQLAKINTQIDIAEKQGSSANDLEDQFDQLLDELSAYGNVSVQKNSNGGTIVYLGTDELVKGNQYHALTSNTTTADDGTETTNLVWADTKGEISGLSGGKIYGLTEYRDQQLAGYQKSVDDLAVSFAQTVNSVHAAGYGLDNTTGLNFFNPTTTGAADIAISTDVSGNANRIAASSTVDATGNNENALQIANLRSAGVYQGNSYGDSLGEIFSQIGRDSKAATSYTTSYTSTSTQIDNLRESVKGVSLNDEAANLLKYQQAFQAAAKVVEAANSVLSVVIGMVE